MCQPTLGHALDECPTANLSYHKNEMKENRKAAKMALPLSSMPHDLLVISSTL